MFGSTVMFLAAESEPSGAALVLPAQAELIWGLVGFALLFIVIQTKVWPSVNQTLDERRNAIQGRIDEAEAQLAAAEKTRRDYEASLSEARTEANQIVAAEVDQSRHDQLVDSFISQLSNQN